MQFHCIAIRCNKRPNFIESKANRMLHLQKIQHAESAATPLRFISDKSKRSRWAQDPAPTDCDQLRQSESQSNRVCVRRACGLYRVSQKEAERSIFVTFIFEI